MPGKNFKNDGNQKIILADKANFSFDFGLILTILRNILPLCIVFSPITTATSCRLVCIYIYICVYLCISPFISVRVSVLKAIFSTPILLSYFTSTVRPCQFVHICRQWMLSEYRYSKEKLYDMN